MNYTKPTRLDGRWQIEEFCCSPGGELDSVEVYKQRDNGSRGTICQIENPDMGEAKEPGQSAGDLALISASPLMYEFLVEIENTPDSGEAINSSFISIRHRAKEIRSIIEEEAGNLIAEAEDAYADAGL
jgi:hypothetical protein